MDCPAAWDKGVGAPRVGALRSPPWPPPRLFLDGDGFTEVKRGSPRRMKEQMIDWGIKTHRTWDDVWQECIRILSSIHLKQQKKTFRLTWNFLKHCAAHELLETLCIEARSVNRDCVLQRDKDRSIKSWQILRFTYVCCHIYPTKATKKT